MTAKKRGNCMYLGALLLLLGGVGYLGFTGFSEGTVHELSVGQIAEVSPEKQKAARLSGKVAATEGIILNNAPAMRFLIEDTENKSPGLWVLYKGSLPDTFKPGAEVIIEGGYDSERCEFSASKLTTKCPSKYEKEYPGTATGSQHPDNIPRAGKGVTS